MTAPKGRRKAVESAPRPRQWATLKEAADYAGVSLRTIYRMRRDGRLPVHRVGTTTAVRVDLVEVDELVMRKCPTINDAGYELPRAWR